MTSVELDWYCGLRHRFELARGLTRNGFVPAMAVACAAFGVVAGCIAGHASRPAVAHGIAPALRSLPAPARSAVSGEIGSADPAYHARADRAGATATNPAQHLKERFSASGLVVRSGSSVLGLDLSSIATAKSSTRLRLHAPVITADRVAYTSSGVSEWLVNGPFGLEQGFDVERPSGGDVDSVTLSMRVFGNLTPKLYGHGHGLDFDRADGSASLVYNGLSVTDSGDRSLPARMVLDGDQLQIAVDTRGARWPLTVDPWLQSASLSDPEGDLFGGYGYADSVAISGSTLVVGMPDLEVDGATGVVFVFNDDSGTWTSSQTILNPDTSSLKADDSFGATVATDGTTMVVGDTDYNDREGTAWVYDLQAGAWTRIQQLTDPLNHTVDQSGSWNINDEFGSSPWVSGSYMLVADPYVPEGQSVYEAGYWIVYELNNGYWQNTSTEAYPAALGFTEPAALAIEPQFLNGSLTDGTLMVGGFDGEPSVNGDTGSGIVQIYGMSDGQWTDPTSGELANPAPAGTYSDEDLFGISGAISGSTLVIGASGVSREGAVYTYTEQPDGSWALQQTLTDPATTTLDQFGHAVSTDGLQIAVGDPEYETSSGQTYVFNGSGPGTTSTSSTSSTSSVSSTASTSTISSVSQTTSNGASPTAAGSTSSVTFKTASIGNQKIALTLPVGSLSGTLDLSFSSTTSSGSKQPALHFESAAFYLDKGIKHTTRRKIHGQTVTRTTYEANSILKRASGNVSLSLKALKPGAHSLRVTVDYGKMVKVRKRNRTQSEIVTVAKTITTRVTIR